MHPLFNVQRLPSEPWLRVGVEPDKEVVGRDNGCHCQRNVPIYAKGLTGPGQPPQWVTLVFGASKRETDILLRADRQPE